MKRLLKTMFSLSVLAVLSVGCGPRPIVEEPVQQRPAVEVDVNRDGVKVETEPADDDRGVEVQVGGGQGIKVETERAD
jgi:hypothetical protein